MTRRTSKHWEPWPNWLRWCLAPAVLAYLARGANLVALGFADDGRPGHVNMEAVLNMLGVAILATGLVVNQLRHTYPVRVWDRLNWVREQTVKAKGAASTPDEQVPVMLPLREVVELAKSKGTTPNASPPVPGGWDDFTVTGIGPRHPSSRLRGIERGRLQA